jgi:ferredoxin-NADP reductase
VRLTAEDGYQAQRSYSIASAPEDEHVALTVERIDDGEVSPYLVDELRPATRSSCAGRSAATSPGGRGRRPLLLIGGGSGLVPLMAMLRHHAAQRSGDRAAAARLGAQLGPTSSIARS